MADEPQYRVIDRAWGDVLAVRPTEGEAEQAATNLETIEITVNGGCLPGRYAVEPVPAA